MGTIKKLNGLSLFSSAGIGEILLTKKKYQICVANELINERSELYKKIHPMTIMVNGDISLKNTKNKILDALDENIDFIIASPPCQGLSLAGKNRRSKEFTADNRNNLILDVIYFIKKLSPSFALIENVPTLLKLELLHKKKVKNVIEILQDELKKNYHITHEIIDSSDFGIPQKRLRAIIKIYKKNITWPNPVKTKHITVRDAIGHLPTLESGQHSNIPFHYARNHTPKHVEWMQNTPTGKSAFENKVYYPKKNGARIKGFNSSYRRIKWDAPAPTITIRSDAISSQRNVHPGHLKKDGLFSDARVLSPAELMILNSIPEKNKIPINTNELLIRKVIGESVPPLLIKKLFGSIQFA